MSLTSVAIETNASSACAAHLGLVEDAEPPEPAGLKQLAPDEDVLRRPELRRQRQILEDGLDPQVAWHAAASRAV